MRNQIVQSLADQDLLRLRESLQSSISSVTAPPIQINLINDFSTYEGSYIGGLSYPLKLDGNGGLRLSFGDDRILEQITEVLETRIGERIWRQFFGMPDVLFESISEDILSNMIKKQLERSISGVGGIDFKVGVQANENGEVFVGVSYAIEGNKKTSLTYRISYD